MKKYIPYVIVMCIIALCGVSGFASQIFHGLSEYRFKLSARVATGDIVLVAIDAKSLKQLDQWPWPRNYHAQIIDKLRTAGATEIALDIDFSSRSKPEHDEALKASLIKAGGSVILASFYQYQSDYHAGGEFIASKPLQMFEDHSWLGSVNVQPHKNGLIYAIPYGTNRDGQFIPSLASMLSNSYKETTATQLIDFGIQSNSILIVSYVDVLLDKVDANIFKGKKVLVGATATELGDRFVVPVQGIISGPMLQILAAETLIQKRALSKTGLLTTVAGLILILFLAMWLLNRKQIWVRLALFLVVMLGIEVVSTYVQMSSAIQVDTSLWQVALVLCFLADMLSEINLKALMLRLTQTRLEKTQLLFEQVVSDSFSAIIVANSDGKIRSINEAATDLLQAFDKSDCLGKKYLDVLPEEVSRRAALLLTKLDNGTGQKYYRGEMNLAHQDGEPLFIEYVISLSRIKTKTSSKDDLVGNNYFLTFILQDITESKLALIAQEKATAAAVSADKAKSEFLATMSHELKTPLNSIIGYSDLLAPSMSDKFSKEESEEFAKNINVSGHQLLDIVNGILEISRLESGTTTFNESEFDLYDVVDLAIETIELSNKGRIPEILFECPEGLPAFYGDNELIHNVCCALLSNAVKFSDPTDKIEVHVYENSRKGLSISVKDNGIGINALEIDRVIKPFYQVDSSSNRQHEGCGIGLTMADASVRLHDGHMKIESDPGAWTKVTISFPAERVKRSMLDSIDKQDCLSDIRLTA